MSTPVLHLLVGPNGAGRTTLAHRVILPVTGLPFVNVDEIAAQRWPGAEMEHGYDASRAAQEQRRGLMSQRQSFVTETVFSHPSKIALAQDAVALGYLVHLHVVMLPIDVTLGRVVDRVRRAEGHDVPPVKIRERYDRLWAMLALAITSVDRATIHDNSTASRPYRVVAEYEHGFVMGDPAWPVWTPSALHS